MKDGRTHKIFAENKRLARRNTIIFINGILGMFRKVNRIDVISY